MGQVFKGLDDPGTPGFAKSEDALIRAVNDLVID